MSASNEVDKIVYHHNVIEFAQVSVQYCKILEQSASSTPKYLINTLLKLIPLLYVKTQLLPEAESRSNFLPDEHVTEEDYNYIRETLASLLSNDDEYLDVVYDEMLQTDETQWKHISEQLADVYQPVRNFLAVYNQGIEDCMYDALWSIRDTFELYWGQELVDALRRLHRIKYLLNNDQDEDFEE